MKKKGTSKFHNKFAKTMLVGAIVAIANRLSMCEKEKELNLNRRKKQNIELKAKRKFFTDEERELW